MAEIRTLGFVGVGVMGEPMCRNLAKKSGLPVLATDVQREPLERLAADGVQVAHALPEIARRAEVIFLSLPGGEQLRQVCLAPEGLLAAGRRGQTIVDTSTSPVGLTRELAARFAEKGIDYADAPVARTREAAQKGTLSIMVGGEERVFERIRPLLAHMASDITFCGPVGCGQVMKLMNNMILFQEVVALAEALTIARRAGLEGEVLFNGLMKGSSDSFALRNHGMKSLLPGIFPERSFSTEYALKDLACALELAEEHGVAAPGARLARELLTRSRKAGYGKVYWPALLHIVDPELGRG